MRRRALAVLVALALAGVLTVALWPRGTPTVAAAPVTVPTTAAPATTTTTAPPVAFLAADAVAAEVPVYPAPDLSAAPIITLTNPTPEDVPLVLSAKAPPQDGWVLVQYNRRPNGASGWVRATDVALRPVANRVVVEVAAKRLRAYAGRSDQVLFEATVATGAPSTPTPLGDFYIDTIVKLERSGGVYGAYQLSVAGFSDVLQSFGGGAGQIALHGTNQPELIGQDISNGCIRLTNEDITALRALVAPGSPVTIVA